MRKREIYIAKYGPVVGGKLYHTLQSQAAHASVSARLRRKLEAIQRGESWPPLRLKAESETLPLFQGLEALPAGDEEGLVHAG